MIRYETLLVGAAAAAVREVLPPITQNEMPPGLWPAPGDLIRDARFGDFTFVVVRRQFAWDAAGDCAYTVALDLIDNPGQARACDGVNVIPFARPGDNES